MPVAWATSRARACSAPAGRWTTWPAVAASATCAWASCRPLAPVAGRIDRMEALAPVELAPPFHEFGQARDLFGDGSLLAVPLPGHAAGHHGLLFEDQQGPVLLVADASWSSQSIVDNTPPPALVTGWLGDTAQYRQTLARLHRLHHAAPDVRIVPAHCSRWRPRRTARR